MSYEPDTMDRAIREVREELNKIREQQFFKAFSTGSGGSGVSKSGSSIGGSLPATGIASFTPNAIRLTKDTGVIDKLDYKNLVLNMDFTIGETITGGTSGATAVIGDIDILTSTTGVLILVPNSISGVFVDSENLTGDINGDADVDGTLYTQTGRGHLNAGSASIIVIGVDLPYEIHFIDNAKQNGQIVLLRAQDTQTIKVRRAVTNDRNTGNIDLDSSFNIVENAIVILQYQGASNVTPDGGWVPVLSSVTTTTGTGTGIDFPILYPKEDLGDQSFVTVSLLLNQSNGHYKRIRMTGDISLAFNSPPPSTNGFKFYVLLVQDGTGGWDLTSLPTSVKNGSSILTQIDSTANSQTLIQFVTADGGITYHAQIIQPSGSAIDNPWTTNHDANTYDLFNLDKLLFAPAGGFSFPTDNTLKGFSTSGTGIEANVSPSQQYRWYIGGFEHMTLDTFDLFMHNFNIRDLKLLAFSNNGSFSAQIASIPSSAQLNYSVVGAGANHGFYVDNGVNANMEMRLNVNKSNVNLDMVTNDILNIDQAQFDQFGGFVPSINHGERRITGGNAGININIPQPPEPILRSLRIWIENATQTNSNVEYEFNKDKALWNNNIIQDLGGIIFTPFSGFSASISPLFNFIEYNTGVSTMAHRFNVAGIQVLEINGTETGTNQGKIKLFHDLNLQTQDITNVDRLHFNSNNGLVGGNQFAIAGDFPLGRGFQFNAPLSKQFRFSENDIPIMQLTNGLLEMKTTVFEPNPTISTHQLFLSTHTAGITGMGDGVIRLVNNGGSFDVMVGTGGFIRNLTNPGTTSFVGFTADDDLNMGTFNIFNVDVIRYAIDSGVIGFGEYGSAVDSTNTKLKWSVPINKFYEFEVNLDPVASISTAGIQALSNTLIPNPSVRARELALSGAHTGGVSGMANGAFRLVGTDVIVRTGSNNLNLSSLVASSGATRQLDNLLVTSINADLLPQTNLSIGSSLSVWDDVFAKLTDYASVASTNSSRRQIFRDVSGGIGVNVPTGDQVRFYRQGTFGFGISGNDITVTGYTNTNRIQLGVSPSNPTFPGEFRMVGSDVFVFSGGVARNLSSIGVGGVDQNNTWTGTNTFTAPVTFTSNVTFVDGTISIFDIAGTAVNLITAQTITGNKTFSGSSVFSGSWRHTGSQLAFFGSSLQSKLPTVSATGSLASVTSAFNLLRNVLVQYGLIN